ncbi:hypothetical protein ASD99_21395 [Mesorhizobium sp. Root695]|nr:hypothetical protein ASD99_21395 [Mesorhizobium sp. Root695]
MAGRQKFMRQVDLVSSGAVWTISNQRANRSSIFEWPLTSAVRDVVNEPPIFKPLEGDGNARAPGTKQECFPFANSRTGNLAISLGEARSMRDLRLNSIETSALPQTRSNVLRRHDEQGHGSQ